MTNSSLERKKIFWIVGEKSGENIACGIIPDLKKAHPDLEMYGITGDQMEILGVKSVFKYEDISVVGFLEVILELPSIICKLIDVVREILRIKPDLVISVDSYDFCINVARLIRLFNKKMQLLHIVSPSVWAYRAYRAKMMAKNYNHLLCFLPSEPAFFEKYKSDKFSVKFIGYPVIYELKKTRKLTDKRTDLVGITLGSRMSEIERHIELIQGTVNLIQAAKPDVHFIIFATINTIDIISSYFASYKNVEIILNDKRNKARMQECTIAIAKSGTNAIEFSALCVPIIVYYKLSKLTFFIGKLLASVRYITLINIIARKEIIPEFFAKIPTSQNLSKAAIKLLNSSVARDKQIAECKDITDTMYDKSESPFTIATRYIAEKL